MRAKLFLLLLFLSPVSHAVNDDPHQLQTSGLINHLVDKFVEYSNGCAAPIQQASERLFWILVSISVVTSGIKLIFKDGDLQSFFLVLSRMLVVIGIYEFLLKNGTQIGISIIDSMTSITYNHKVGPAEIMDEAINIGNLLNKGISLLSLNLITGLTMTLLVMIFLIVMFLIAVRYACIFICAHVLTVCGVFVLGFGAFEPTREIALNYLRQVIACALELMTTILIANTGFAVLNEISASLNYSGKTLDFTDCEIVLLTSLFIYVLSINLPTMIGNLVYSGGKVQGFNIINSVRSVGSVLKTFGGQTKN